jgi:hypothetical protein
MMESGRSSIPVNRKTREIESRTSPLSSTVSPVPFQNTYRNRLRYTLKSYPLSLNRCRNKDRKERFSWSITHW